MFSIAISVTQSDSEPDEFLRHFQLTSAPRHWSGSDKVARKTGEDGKTGVTERGPGHGPPPVRIVTDPKGFLFFFLFLFPFFFTLRMLLPITYRYPLES